ncbi:uncharacterized protein ACBT57_011656 isoform 2-T4 [Dama dama]
MRGRRLSPPAPARGPEVFRRPAAWPEVLAVRHLGDLLQTDKKEIQHSVQSGTSQTSGTSGTSGNKWNKSNKWNQNVINFLGKRLGSQDKCSQLK